MMVLQNGNCLQVELLNHISTVTGKPIFLWFVKTALHFLKIIYDHNYELFISVWKLNQTHYLLKLVNCRKDRGVLLFLKQADLGYVTASICFYVKVNQLSFSVPMSIYSSIIFIVATRK